MVGQREPFAPVMPGCADGTTKHCEGAHPVVEGAAVRKIARPGMRPRGR
jgi:hypothetical protein